MLRPTSSTGIRISPRHGADAAAQDLRQALSELEARIAERQRELARLWPRARIADRTLAVHRLLKHGLSCAEDAAALEQHEQRVAVAWSLCRGAKAAGEKARVLQLEVECQLAERTRDRFLDRRGLLEALFRVSESFLLDMPYDREMRPLGELLSRRERILDQLARLEARSRQRRSAIRVLSPLSMSGEAIEVVSL
jgi:hypothetical protein